MNIAVIPNISKDVGLVTTKRFINSVGKRAAIVMDKMYNTGQFDAQFRSGDILSGCDIAVVLGGDGTILSVAAECAKKSIPILGINLGRIGFMSEIEKDDIEEAAARLLSGDYKTDSRMMLKTDIVRDGELQGTFHALNDVVISKANDVKLISTAVYCEDEKINEYVCDGLIISTPTGSTGYNLSAGGPVINPNMRLLAATPICAHMLTAKPMIIPSQPPIKIRLSGRTLGNSAEVVSDGDVVGHIKDGDEIIVSRSEYETKLIRMGSCSFYDVLINKLT